ncbi:APC family permease [Micromonospora cathayae]|uniref:APC family permease n=1 Tax=Micromonospora cathayae TaxID=3028804 RepID=A0ABY7ZI74_9ACTN|nr:APC family permease [Micromonospora sp. HUAS 3]WDZ82136.1 APC family permease [Micromonospora sp. HUAS 3]
MHPSATPGRPDDVPEAVAAGGRGVPSVLLFTLSAAAPLTVAAGAMTIGYAVTGRTGLAPALLAVALVLALFTVGYVAMSHRIATVGGFHAHVARGLGRPAGVGVAWVALIARNALQVGLYGLVGAAGAPLLVLCFGVAPSWWLLTLAAWALVAVLGVLRVDVTGPALAVLLSAQVIVLLVFDLGQLLRPADGTVDLAPLSPAHLVAPGVGALFVVAVIGFVGFESAVLLREESRDPRRTVPAATYLAVGTVGVLLAFTAWTTTVATGPDRVVAAAGEQGVELLFNLAGEHLGAGVVPIGLAVLTTSVLAALVSLHHSVARYAFALGRERVLPAAFGRATPRTGAPRVASAAQSVLGFVVIAGCVVAGVDPVRDLFYRAAVLGGLGLLLATTVTSLAVLVFFVRVPTGEHPWRRMVAPGLATVALVAMSGAALADVGTLLGGPAESVSRWAFPAVFPLVALLGTGWALRLRARHPRGYARLGLGPEGAAAELLAPPGGPERPVPLYGRSGRDRS